MQYIIGIGKVRPGNKIDLTTKLFNNEQSIARDL